MKQFPILTEIDPEVLHGAMDSHAKNISLGFADWILSEGYVQSTKSDKWCRKYGGVILSTTELYTLYINDILK